MGTVGINFGSPTTGSGFNVSNTVSQIVANLQNIETPWKNQLASFQSQDTAISSLGTLLSTLSNDIGQFTDFQGVLAGKQGSSSDPNVIALTAASSAAAAGNHTIVVNSLATTATGSFSPVQNASDTLAGSITINQKTIDLSTLAAGSQNLAGLASAINSANLGVNASVLTDSAGSILSLVSNISGAAGNFTVTGGITDSSNGNAALTYTAAPNAVDASLTVDNVAIQTGSNTVSTVIPGVTFQLLSPSPVTGSTAEPVQVQILNDNTAVVSSVTQLVSDYNAVVSAVNTQEKTSGSGTTPPLFGSPTLTLLQEQLFSSVNATSPTGYLDELPKAKANDTLTGSLSIAVGSGAATTFNLSSLPAGQQNLAGLSAAINKAGLGVSASVYTDSTGSRLALVSELTGASGALTVSSTVADGSTTLNYNNQGAVNNLTQLGISVNDDGTLALDGNSLNSKLNSDYSSVVSFFQNVDSWGAGFSTALANLGTSNVSGTLALALKSNSAIEASLNTDLSNEDRIISTEQVSLTLELTSANEILQAIPSNLNSVAEIYSAITGYTAPRF